MLYKYKVKFTDKKRWFLGIAQNKKWNLYAQQLDPFAVHEWFGYELSRGTGEYTVGDQFCEVGLCNMKQMPRTGDQRTILVHFKGANKGADCPMHICLCTHGRVLSRNFSMKQPWRLLLRVCLSMHPVSHLHKVSQVIWYHSNTLRQCTYLAFLQILLSAALCCWWRRLLEQ